MPTLKDVARETGLTVSTVSRVLNNRGYISEETRKNVYDAMKKLNYQPNELARSLSKKTTNTIGVIVPHIKHPYFAELISRIEWAASKKDYKILLFNSQDKDEKEMKILEMCKSNRVAGVILCSGSVTMDYFAGLDVPLITIERNLENGTATVECDNEKGGRIAAKYLIDKGCKNLVQISGVLGNQMPADAREIGFVDVCKAENIRHQVYYTDEKQYNAGVYHEAVERILRENPEIDGIFASSDLIAAQTIQVCAKLNIKIPEQVQLIGFDDVMISALTSPAITTIHQPIKEMADAAVFLLVQAVNKKMVPSRTILPVTLIERETTK